MSLDTASDPEKRLTGAHMLVANVALLGGIVTGLRRDWSTPASSSRRASTSGSPTTTV
jgi:hypothetical protein